MSAKQLPRDVERRLSRPALGAPAETDVAIEGFIEKTPEGTFHAVVTIADARGKLLGKRELERPECSDIDAALALAVALMIDPGRRVFANRASGGWRARTSFRRHPSRARTSRCDRSAGLVSAGVGLGFGALPRTSREAWMLASGRAAIPVRFELGAHLSAGPDGWCRSRRGGGVLALDPRRCGVSHRRTCNPASIRRVRGRGSRRFVRGRDAGADSSASALPWSMASSEGTSTSFSFDISLSG